MKAKTRNKIQLGILILYTLLLIKLIIIQL